MNKLTESRRGYKIEGLSGKPIDTMKGYPFHRSDILLINAYPFQSTTNSRLVIKNTKQ